MPVIVERVGESCKLGEGPHWDAESQSLYYVDIFEHTIHKYNPSTKEHTKAYVGKGIYYNINKTYLLYIRINILRRKHSFIYHSDRGNYRQISDQLRQANR